MLPFVGGVVACSPIHWLNENSYQYWEKLVDNYQQKQCFVDVVLLEGEPFIDEETIKPKTIIEPVPTVEWRLILDDHAKTIEQFSKEWITFSDQYKEAKMAVQTLVP